MKRAVILITLFLSITTLSAQSLNKIVNDKNGKPMLIGKTTKTGFQQDPFNEWYTKNYNDYLENDKVITKLKDSLNQYTIKVFFGSWCGDSKRELPRFYKILDHANFPESQLEVYGLDNATDTYKQSPEGYENDLNIHRVPTFVFYKNGTEVNRIVEYPKQTLERDMLAIVEGKRYMPNYIVPNYIDELFKTNTIDTLRQQQKELVPYLSNFVKGSKELNTYGYVNLKSKNYDKALYAFEFNTKLYPYKSNVYDSLGEYYFETKNYTEALKNYNKVLELKPNDENATEMIEKITEAMK